MPDIRLSKKNKTIKVVNRRENIRLTHTKGENIRLEHTGKTGPASTIPGPEGLSAYDVAVEEGFTGTEQEWLDSLVGPQGPVGSDLTYLTSFTVSDEVLVQHNLGKMPAISVIDSAGDEVEGQVEYLDNTRVLVRFASPFSGQITCN